MTNLRMYAEESRAGPIGGKTVEQAVRADSRSPLHRWDVSCRSRGRRSHQRVHDLGLAAASAYKDFALGRSSHCAALLFFSPSTFYPAA